jgi:hypothetical protein
VSGLEFRPMCAGDAVLLSMQPSQFISSSGSSIAQYTMEEGHELAEGGIAWTAIRGSRIVGIAGFREIWTGHARRLGDALRSRRRRSSGVHALCSRAQIAAAPYRRIEAIVEKDNAARDRMGEARRPRGGSRAPRLRREGKTHILFEKVNV